MAAEHNENDVSTIYDSLLKILDQNKIDEVDFVPDLIHYVPGATSSAPIPFIFEDAKLGLSFWCITKLYKFTIAQIRRVGARNKTNFTTAEALTVISATRILLLISADNYSAWNIRKRLLLSGHVTFSTDLALTSLVLCKHPKSGETWHHRLWLLQRHLSENPDLQAEFRICKRVAEAYAKNYFAWSHRLWTLKHCAYDQAKEELSFARDWCSRHVSDHAALHHRRSVLLQLSKLSRSDSSQREEVFCLYAEELKILSELQTFFTGHEAMWHCRRGILSDYLPHLKEHNSNSASGSSNVVAVNSLLSSEWNFALRCAENSRVERFDAQRRAAIGYLIWIYKLKGNSVEKLLRAMFVQRDLTATFAMLKVLQRTVVLK